MKRRFMRGAVSCVLQFFEKVRTAFNANLTGNSERLHESWVFSL